MLKRSQSWNDYAWVWGIVLSAQSAGAAVWYVDVAATGPVQDGTTWCFAFLDLQDALLAAAADDEIRVAAGTYRPDGATLDRQATFTLLSRVTLRGGYAGCGATNPDERELALFPSVLSGDLAADDGPSFANYGDNSFHVVTYSDPQATGAVLDGFTVQGGNADGTGPGGFISNQGGAVHIRNSLDKCMPGGPVLRNCVFRDNWGLHHGAVNDHGLSTIIEDCLFLNNYAGEEGAGLQIHSGSPSVARCTFVNNRSDGNGGGVWAGRDDDPTCSGPSQPTITDCSFSMNQAIKGGGVYAERNGPIVLNGTFTANRVAKAGGGIYMLQSQGSITGTTFRDHYLEGSDQKGAGIYLEECQINVTTCEFRNNSVYAGGGYTWEPEYGGGGGAYVNLSTVSFTDCVFEDNLAVRYGGGVFVQNSTVSASGCSFLGNYGTSGGALYGAGLDVSDCRFIGNMGQYGSTIYGSAVTLENSNFIENLASYDGLHLGAHGNAVTGCRFVGNWSGDHAAALHFEGGSGVITNCLFIRNESEVVGGGVSVVSASPAFLNCTFFANSASHGGGAWVHSGNPGFRNCIFWDNTDDSGVGESAQVHFVAVPPQPWIPPGSVDFRNCCLRDWSGTLPGEGNFGADPLFFDPDGPDQLLGTDDDNFRLASASPAIDAGDNTYVYVSHDFAGNPRIDGAAVDLGAYEYACLPGVYADVDRSGVVELGDLLCLLAGYLLRTDCSAGDIWPCPGGDGLIELGDVLAFLDSYSGNPPCVMCGP